MTSEREKMQEPIYAPFDEEKKPLEIHRSKAELTTGEKIMSTCMDTKPPISYLCQSGLERKFRDRIESGELVNRNPTFAYRADARSPDDIFSNGFSVYSAKRLVEKTFCDAPVCLVAGALFLPFALLCCIASYFPDRSSDQYLCTISPGDCLGQNYYRQRYITGNGALALSKEYQNAIAYFSGAKAFWRYVVYLPDGFVDFTKFCQDNDEEDEKLYGIRHYDDDGAHNVGEIIPNGRQKISPEHIIAAVKYEKKYWGIDGGVGQYTEAITSITLNVHSIFYSRLKQKFDFIDGQISPTSENKDHLLKSVTLLSSECGPCPQRSYGT
jgi:hypothetical protein